ncbi:hypothetical protein SAMN02745166_02626 [Prosthecobacter debontii]|uniref:Uncharacterized protein n=1 Tax=Prosthecobacter debontii TaxID=48467 RepID=A0A1T4Y985_9BACT|nr:hypothetical protein [Prosthecobacter debontii]SKA97835.1 hypothetical protein SAMN02745166_02626 [Prosthecobacter debontii]
MSSVLPIHINWPSAIGNYLLNFSMLDLSVLNFVKRRSPAEETAKLERMHFQDRVKRMRQMVEQAPDLQPQHAQFQILFEQIESLRDLRNLLAHGVLSVDFNISEREKEVRLCLRLPRDIGKPESDVGPGLSFEDLLSQLQPLADLNGELQQLEGGCEVTELSGPTTPQIAVTSYLYRTAHEPTTDS